MRPHHLIRIIPLLILVAATASCASRIPRRRSLPAWVENINIPMATNSTSEPGLEEWVTISMQEEFLADGRLKVSSKADADVIVAVNITDYVQEVDSFEDDEFPSVSRVTAEASIRLYEPSNLDRPFAELDRVVGSHSFISDFRRTDYAPDVDAKKLAMHALANAVVQEVITGYEVTEEVDREDELLAVREADAPYGVRTARGITISPDVPKPVR